jgi:hypothetical protein
MLKLSDINGVVDITPECIARRTNVPLDIVKKGISELEKPDPRSRNPDHEGRRIARIDHHRDWGWVICNYAYYRNLVTEEQRREKTKLRTQKWREKLGPVARRDARVTQYDASDAMQKKRQTQMQTNKTCSIKNDKACPIKLSGEQKELADRIERLLG